MIAMSVLKVLRRQTQEDKTTDRIISLSQPYSGSEPAQLAEKKGSSTELRSMAE